MLTITPYLWFDTQAEEAANFYVSLFPGSRIIDVTRLSDPDRQERVAIVTFEVNGQRLTALNGGPHYRLSPAFSLEVTCETQAEVDRYWDALSEGGEEHACGWLVDRFGLSWQVIPTALMEALSDPDSERAARATAAMLQMKKIDIAAIEAARAG